MYDATVKSGNTFTLDLTLKDNNKVPVSDLVGATATMQWRVRLLDELAVITANGVIDPVLGTVQFTVSDEETALLLDARTSKTKYVYGCKLFYADGTALTFLTGKITVEKGVVRL